MHTHHSISSPLQGHLHSVYIPSHKSWNTTNFRVLPPSFISLQIRCGRMPDVGLHAVCKTSTCLTRTHATHTQYISIMKSHLHVHFHECNSNKWLKMLSKPVFDSRDRQETKQWGSSRWTNILCLHAPHLRPQATSALRYSCPQANCDYRPAKCM